MGQASPTRRTAPAHVGRSLCPSPRAAPQDVGEAQTTATELLTKHTVLLLEVFDHLDLGRVTQPVNTRSKNWSRATDILDIQSLCRASCHPSLVEVSTLEAAYQRIIHLIVTCGRVDMLDIATCQCGDGRTQADLSRGLCGARVDRVVRRSASAPLGWMCPMRERARGPAELGPVSWPPGFVCAAIGSRGSAFRGRTVIHTPVVCPDHWLVFLRRWPYVHDNESATRSIAVDGADGRTRRNHRHRDDVFAGIAGRRDFVVLIR